MPKLWKISSFLKIVMLLQLFKYSQDEQTSELKKNLLKTNLPDIRN